MEQSSSSSAKQVWESVKTYTVQCASCSKLRLVPSKEQYEGIRERIDERPFTCDMARQQWRPDISCDKESDIKREDQGSTWAMQVQESVKASTVQCASCSEWRLVPLKELYEDVRERIDELPFDKIFSTCVQLLGTVCAR
ncbi:Methyl-CPG-binding domain protein 02 isoform 1 [Dorcoceras hygrometricum]|uniref:Methyl-CPG-binding domain protein 02 isoform 1 n=1 Tax=Dorcoceras hygrometricum TaxID=472368 RepID=A0A2Z7A4S6_9LAMI|nr:Methyl-CPG-binding domain protein 02 isoform 1 [Dorcoceras hygrometricum]